jgi:membrane protease YdiL (CAAX protease family)
MSLAPSPPPAIAEQRQAERKPLYRRLWDGLFHPEIKLPIEIPWDLKQFSRLYVVAAIWYALGSIIPLFIIFGIAFTAIKLRPDVMVQLLLTADGSPNVHLMLAAMLVSFVGGFGAELLYFNHQLKKEGLSLVRILHLNLDSLNGSWFEAVKRSTCALAIGLLGQNLMEHLPHLPHPQQVTAELASGLQGGGLLAFAVLAAVMAPFFEEIIFRGFLFNSLRKVFREGRVFRLCGSSHRVADYCAVALSALMFAVAHMDATAFLQLFLLGALMAEIYRRSGTLVCPMLLHAMNNIVATLLIMRH